MPTKAEEAQFSPGYKSRTRLDLFHVNLLNNERLLWINSSHASSFVNFGKTSSPEANHLRLSSLSGEMFLNSEVKYQSAFKASF